MIRINKKDPVNHNLNNFKLNIFISLLTAGLIFTAPQLLLNIDQQMVAATISETTDYLPSTFSGGELPVDNFTATNGYVVSGTTPEGGVDSFSYDGTGHMALKSGILNADVNPENNTGIISANWTDFNDDNWTFVQTEFEPGRQLYFEGILSNGTADLKYGNDSIAVNHWLHGNTKAGPPVLPTEFSYVSSWGIGELWKNGESLGTFSGHLMLTEGVRDPTTGKVFNANQTGLYSPMNPADGYSDPHTAQVHYIIQSSPGAMTNNFPPQFDFTYHLMFYDIQVE